MDLNDAIQTTEKLEYCIKHEIFGLIITLSVFIFALGYFKTQTINNSHVHTVLGLLIVYLSLFTIFIIRIKLGIVMSYFIATQIILSIVFLHIIYASVDANYLTNQITDFTLNEEAYV